jgi:hypothetical protein
MIGRSLEGRGEGWTVTVFETCAGGCAANRGDSADWLPAIPVPVLMGVRELGQGSASGAPGRTGYKYYSSCSQ